MNWISEALGDPHYRILPNPGGGDCLFHVVSQATGIPAARVKRTVADRATDEEFRVKKAMYESAKKGLMSDDGGGAALEYARDYLDYAWMEGVDGLERYRDLLARCGTWGDGESVQHIEKILRCRVLVLCRELPGICYRIPSSVRDPKFYLLVNYSGAHFELVTWAGRGTFVAANVPKEIKRIFGIS